jgi:hypothetical protein
MNSSPNTLTLFRMKTKKPPIKSLKDKLWKLTSQIVRLQSDSCYTCGKLIPDFRQRAAGHFWSKGGHGATRFHLDNLRVQCFGCNSFKSGNLAEYSSRLLKEIGQERFDELYRLAHLTRPSWKRDELENLITEREELLQNLTQ